jgi:mevalonate kinase
MMKKKVFFAPGKLMLTGEYVVLNGAKSLAFSTGKYGQFLEVENHDYPYHLWRSFEYDHLWFEAKFSPDLQRIIRTNDNQKAAFLLRILRFIKKYKPELFLETKLFVTRLNFAREWGFGSSSSLLVLLYRWSGINPFLMNQIFFGGSGYDIAVGIEQKALVYQLKEGAEKYFDFYPSCNEPKKPVWEILNGFDFPFKKDLKLIYLNQKQKSAQEIKKYKTKSVSQDQIQRINQITDQIIKAENLNVFEKLIKEHEQIISVILGRPRIKERLFPDFDGEIKSLGAWGGDFILATGHNALSYFDKKGYKTHFDFCKILK